MCLKNYYFLFLNKNYKSYQVLLEPPITLIDSELFQVLYSLLVYVDVIFFLKFVSVYTHYDDKHFFTFYAK